MQRRANTRMDSTGVLWVRLRALRQCSLQRLLSIIPCFPRACLAGYSTGDPSQRLPGAAGSGLAYVALVLSTVAVGLRTALHF